MGCGGSKASQASPPTPPASSSNNQGGLLNTDANGNPKPGEPVAAGDPAAAPAGSYSDSNSVYNPQSGMMRKQITMTSERQELDVYVSQFKCHDSTVGSAVGRNTKDIEWQVMYDLDSPPIAIAVHVQERKLHSNEVSIECNGQAIFTGAGAKTGTKMNEDFNYQWPFRGAIKGINDPEYFEIRPQSSMEWFACTITGQRKDGFYEVTAYQLDNSGYRRAVQYPAVDKKDLRESSTRRALQVPESTLHLHVPRLDPLKAALSVGGAAITQNFGRPSPPPSKRVQGKPNIQMTVDRDRTQVTASTGHNVLSHFVSGEVRCLRSEIERLSRFWTVQLGPFAEHSVKICKNYTLGKIVTLMIDDEIFVEATAADLGCTGAGWQCNFRFVGERTMDFEVYKTNKDAFPLDETAHVLERRKYVHECSVFLPNVTDWDLNKAQFFIDGKDFRELPVVPQGQAFQDPPLSMDPRAMNNLYGISVPYKVDLLAPSGITAMANNAAAVAVETHKAATGFFQWCCESSAVNEPSDNIRIEPA